MIILLWIALGAFGVIRQFQSRIVNQRSLVVLPAILIVAGYGVIAHLTSVQAGLFLALNVVSVAALGLWRGTSFRLWENNGQVWQKSTVATGIFWLAAIGARIALTLLGVASGLSLSEVTAELPFLLGVTLGAQNLVLWLRSNPALSFAR